ncbi:TPA: dcm methylase, partial [Klebsiella pneumoniae]|nr:dcm methylase [Klebsiella pneumoniae]
MSKGTIICLCDITGVMAKPWVEAGYRAVLVDPQHPETSIDGPVERISATILEAMPRLSQIIRSENVVIVIGFPPCTHVAVSGSRWFESKRAKDPHFQAKAALVAEQCRMVGLAAGCPWAFENPVSVFSSIFGSADYTFHPYQFTG